MTAKDLQAEIAALQAELELAETKGEREAIEFQIAGAQSDLNDLSEEDEFDLEPEFEPDFEDDETDEFDLEEDHYSGFSAPDMYSNFDEENQGW